MKRGAPPFSQGGALPSIGRAARFEAPERCEIWRFSSGDRAVVERLERLGWSFVGGFVDAGEDEQGFWLVRNVGGKTLSDRIKQHSGAFPWRDAVTIAARLAEVLARCENDALFPGPLSPRQVIAAEPSPVVRADLLVATLVGAPPAAASVAESASPRWIAPEQAAGAAWDNAANRYVLGLILYRMLAGEHAFGGRGLRLGLDEQARRAPPPLPDAVAQVVPPGLQSLCLKLLAPNPRERPASAGEVAEKLGQFIGERESKPARVSAPERPAVEEKAPEAAPAAATKKPVVRVEAAWLSRARSWLRIGAPIVIGLGLGGVALAAFGTAPAKDKRPLIREPLAANDTFAADCASCHPRQAGEWHRSVMAHSVKSPMFQALEIVVQEQVGRDNDCPEGAGILRTAGSSGACRDRASGITVTGSGGELWCVNCHSPAYNLRADLPPWDGRSANSRSRQPLIDLLSERAMEGISCGFCHQVHGPVKPGNLGRGRYEGNPFWTSTQNGGRFEMRPEDQKNLFGIANSGYLLDPAELIASAVEPEDRVAGGSHAKPSKEAKEYLGKSQFCGSCHDVRLFGTDVIGAQKGEHFKRLRNGYSEWAAWAEGEKRAGRKPASCQDCHMSTYPGVCERIGEAKKTNLADLPQAVRDACPEGTVFSPRPPGDYPLGRSSTTTGDQAEIRPHYFTGVDIPFTHEFPKDLINEKTVDALGIPLGAEQRRALLLAASVKMTLGDGLVRSGRIELPITVENVGAGHRVPAGFSQERETWVHLKVTDARGDVVYEVGRVDRDDEDLHDKTFLRINTDTFLTDGQGRPQGVFGADVADGPDVGRWSPNPNRGGNLFRGRGLMNFQNGFLRCVVCIGTVDSLGRCQPQPGQDRTRADRFADGAYDPDTGECKSNLVGDEALFETYFPVGALDASRGTLKAPDAIIDTRSLPPGVPIKYIYELDTRGRAAPFTAEARLNFRAFPPYLVRAFIDYEKRQARSGRRPSGPLMDEAMIPKNTIVELARARVVLR